MNLLILALYLLLPLGQLQKLPLGISNVSVYVHDLVLLLILVCLLGHFVISTAVEKSLSEIKKGFFDRAQNDRVFTAFIVFTGIALFSWLGNYFTWGKQSLLGLGYLIRWILLSVPLFLSANHQSRITNYLQKSLMIFALFGILQYILFPDLTQFKYFGWDDHYFRLTGTLLDPNFMGALLVLGLGLEFSNSGFKPFAFGRKLFYLVTLGLTYSRASWLAWLVLLFSYTIRELFSRPIKRDILIIFRTLIRSFKVPAFYFWLIISAAVFLLLPRPEGEGGDLTRTASISGRFKSYQQAWQIIKKNPVLGVGFNNYRLAVSELSNSNLSDFSNLPNLNNNHAGAGADNSFLFVWATTGIFGLLAFVWLVFSWRPVWLILPVVVHAFFNNTLFFPWVLIYLWSLQANED